MEAFNIQAVQVVAPGLQIPVVLFPGCHGVAIDPRCGKNGLPKLFHGLAPSQIREHLFGPSGARDSGNAPLLLILPLIGIGFDNLIDSLTALGHLLQVYALETIGILGNQMNPARKNIHIVLQPGLLPGLHRAQGFDALIANMKLL